MLVSVIGSEKCYIGGHKSDQYSNSYLGYTVAAKAKK